ncbi:zinc-binding dehydrogenase [Rhizobium sp. LCM 4573]|uniref:quinone oxidoreductase family protein n=1 Tax=Rhizobium sp. LCM 4573 TaxID=1848291 RepID=UPI0008D9ABF7|nr:zinc-binding dehydrogenase [Rhizobium sp. LCM 4573]OHV84362.1 NADPH:quinone oxidoreductase [Rhizobium sp. LCM 4573]
MKVVQFSRFGSPEVLEVIEVRKPQPARGEVLIRVMAAGVNFFEVLMRADRYAVTPSLPMAPGVEVAGLVEAVGEGLDDALIGARVAVPLFAIGRGSGGYAEYIIADAGSLARLPEGLSFENAVALMVQGLTALHLVRQNPPAGKTVLVTAAGGGVGSLLVQLLKQAGAESVIAAAGSGEKRALALSLGADRAVGYDMSGIEADIVFDLIGNELTRGLIDPLRPGGRLVLAAMGRFGLDQVDIGRMLEANQSLQGFSLLPLLGETLWADLAELFDRAHRGEIRVISGGRFPLTEAAEAHRAIESRLTTGKVVLVPDS